MDVRKWPMHLSNWLTQIFVPKKEKKSSFWRKKTLNKKGDVLRPCVGKSNGILSAWGRASNLTEGRTLKGTSFPWETGFEKNHFLRPSAAIETTFIHRLKTNHEEEVDICATIANCDTKREFLFGKARCRVNHCSIIGKNFWTFSELVCNYNFVRFF